LLGLSVLQITKKNAETQSPKSMQTVTTHQSSLGLILDKKTIVKNP